MRVNARLDETTSASIERLRATTGWTTTDIIKRGVALVEREQKQQQQTPWSIAQSVGIVGCGEADPGLSSNYKATLTESLEIRLAGNS